MDSYKELLYVTCSGRNTVLVCNINDLKFVKEFGDTKYSPEYIAASREFIYVVSTDEQIVRYKSTDYLLVGVTGTWVNYSRIIGVAVSLENQVFAMNQNSQIRIYDRALNFKEEIQLDLKKFQESNCITWVNSMLMRKINESNENITIISMLMREDRIYLLLDNTVLLFVFVGDWDNILLFQERRR